MGYRSRRLTILMSIAAVVGAAVVAGARQSSDRVFVAIYERGPNWVDSKGAFEQAFVREHIAHFGALGTRVLGAAPIRAQAGDTVVGVIVATFATEAEAVTWFDNDPSIKGGTMRGIIREWGVSEVRQFSRKPLK